MAALHDIRCRECGIVENDAIVDVDNMPECETCGGEMETAYDAWDTAPMIGFWKGNMIRQWNEVDPGNTKERMYGTRRIVVPRNYEGSGNA